MKLLRIEYDDFVHFRTPTTIDFYADKNITQSDKDKLYSLSKKEKCLSQQRYRSDRFKMLPEKRPCSA